MAGESKKLVWDTAGDHVFENGVNKGVLFPVDTTDGTYKKGVAWNGLTGVSESPSGGDATPLYADNIKYLSLLAAEEYDAKITAYTYPDEFGACDGSAELGAAGSGVTIGQQGHAAFGLAFNTAVGNDVDSDAGYKIHIIYGAQAKPSARDYKTINDKPEAIEFSWDITTTPVAVTGHKPTASLVIDSTKVDEDTLAAIEALLYGTDTIDPALPDPDDIIALLTTQG